MNERLKELAVQAGLEESTVHGDWTSLDYPDVRGADLERFANLVRQDEREACAKIALKYEPTERQPYVTYAADEIRARGEK